MLLFFGDVEEEEEEDVFFFPLALVALSPVEEDDEEEEKEEEVDFFFCFLSPEDESSDPFSFVADDDVDVSFEASSSPLPPNNAFTITRARPLRPFLFDDVEFEEEEEEEERKREIEEDSPPQPSRKKLLLLFAATSRFEEVAPPPPPPPRSGSAGTPPKSIGDDATIGGGMMRARYYYCSVCVTDKTRVFFVVDESFVCSRALSLFYISLFDSEKQGLAFFKRGGGESLSKNLFLLRERFHTRRREKNKKNTSLDACTASLFTEKYSRLLIAVKGKNTIRDGINISIDVVDVDFRFF